MSIIWCGGEDIDFPIYSGVVVSTSGAAFRAGYSRCALSLSGGDYIQTPAFAPVSSAWFTGRMYLGDNRNNTKLIRFFNDTIETLYLYYSTSNSRLEFGKAGAGIIAHGVSPVPSALLHRIDICIEGMGAGATGRVRVWLNNQLELDYVGDLSVSGVTSFDRIRFSIDSVMYVGASWSEMILADVDTRLFSLKTLVPKDDTSEPSPGVNTFTSGTYADIDEAVLSDADTIFSEVAGQEFQANLTGMPAGNFIVEGVKLAARMARGPAGIGSMQMGVKTNSTTVLPAAHTLTTAWETKEVIYQQNPATSNRWQPSEIDALQIALKSQN